MKNVYADICFAKNDAPCYTYGPMKSLPSKKPSRLFNFFMGFIAFTLISLLTATLAQADICPPTLNNFLALTRASNAEGLSSILDPKGISELDSLISASATAERSPEQRNQKTLGALFKIFMENALRRLPKSDAEVLKKSIDQSVTTKIDHEQWGENILKEAGLNPREIVRIHKELLDDELILAQKIDLPRETYSVLVARHMDFLLDFSRLLRIQQRGAVFGPNTPQLVRDSVSLLLLLSPFPHEPLRRNSYHQMIAGLQWDYLSLVPKELKVQSISELQVQKAYFLKQAKTKRQKKEIEDLFTLSIKTIENGFDLTKEEFIKWQLTQFDFFSDLITDYALRLGIVAPIGIIVWYDLNND